MLFRSHAKVRLRYSYSVAWRGGICSAVIGSAAQRRHVRAAAEHTRVLCVLARGTVSTHTCSVQRCARVVHRIDRRRRRWRCRRACSLASGRPRRADVRTARRARACARGGLAAHAGEYHEYSHDTLDTPAECRARTVSTHSHRAVELPAHVAVRRTHVGYSE